MEDLDRAREVKGASDDILRTLESFGFYWDEEVIYQSRRTEAYREALDRLLTQEHAYPCGCSRKEINLAASHGIEGAIYPGTCRNGLAGGRQARSIRLRVPNDSFSLADRIQGHLAQNLERDIGDFVVRRADGIHAYQLAVVVDDDWQGINQIVRGADLLLSTPRQIYLQRLLGLKGPSYAHLPLAVDDQGRKLSKSLQELPVDTNKPLRSLLQALDHLGQALPPERPSNLDDFWRWAIDNWKLACVPSNLSQTIHPGLWRSR
jgi:glutamyl-Q tRNA(Asp) synthetase